MAAPRRLLAVLGRVLGNRVYSARLVDYLERRSDVVASYLFLDSEDYRTYQAPRSVRYSSTVESAWVARAKYRARFDGPVDLLLFQGFGLSLFFRDLIRRHPTAVCMDTTPALATRAAVAQRQARAARLAHRAVGTVWRAVYGRIFRDVDAFLPWSHWCASSLQRDFAIDPAKSFVTYCPQDLASYEPPRRDERDERVVLFVGNDFVRKGGDLLVDAYKRRLRGLCRLLIVSNDPAAGRTDTTAGIEVIGNVPHAQMKDIYARADVFAFPTRSEPFGLVLAEAMAAGLPIVASAIGAIEELVKDGYNGVVLPPDGSPDAWGARIRELLGNPDHARTLGKNGRVLAEQLLSVARFESVLDAAFERMLRSRKVTAATSTGSG